MTFNTHAVLVGQPMSHYFPALLAPALISEITPFSGGLWQIEQVIIPSSLDGK